MERTLRVQEGTRRALEQRGRRTSRGIHVVKAYDARGVAVRTLRGA